MVEASLQEQEKIDVSPQSGRKQILPSFIFFFFSAQAFNRLDDAHQH